MDSYTDIAYSSITTYFNTLAKFGYKSYEDVYRMLVLFYIDDIVSGVYDVIPTEDEYRTMMKSLYCLFGSDCMIPYPKYYNEDSLIHNMKGPFIPRETEDEILRFTQNVRLRKEA